MTFPAPFPNRITRPLASPALAGEVSRASVTEGVFVSPSGCHGLLRRTTRASSSPSASDHSNAQVIQKTRVVRLRRSNPWHPEQTATRPSPRGVAGETSPAPATKHHRERSITSISVAFFVAAAVTMSTGCTNNSAKITHGMSFATIEETVQQHFTRGTPRTMAIHIADKELGLMRADARASDPTELTYELAPEVESSLAVSKHRSFLVFEFGDDGLSRAIYVNHWLDPALPHGETEINLRRPTP